MFINRPWILLLSLLIAANVSAQFTDLPDDLLGKGLHAFENRNYDTALAVFDSLAVLEPGNGVVHETRGRILASMKQHFAAIDSYTLGIELMPNRASQYFYRSLSYSFFRNDGKALEDSREALNQDFGNQEYIEWAGVANYKMGNFEKALELYNKVLLEKPDNVDLLYKCGYVLKVLGRDDQAEEILHEAIVGLLGKREIPDQLLLSGIYSLLERFDEAIAITNSLLEDHPDLTFLYGYRGADYLFMGDFDIAQADFAKSIQHDSSDIISLNSNAYCLIELDRSAEAFPILNELLVEFPTYYEAICNRALAHLRLDNEVEAMKDVETALELKPRRPRAHKLHAQVLFKQNKVAEGCAAAQLAIDRYYDGIFNIKPSAKELFESNCQ